jgi:aminopeptidase
VSEPIEQLLEAYAKLIVRVGVNVQFGQRVVVRCAIEHAAVARAVATQAYRAGASHVSINYLDPVLQRAAVDYAPENSLGMSLPHDLEGVRAWREDRPAIIALTGNPHPRLMEGADPKRLAASVPLDLVREIMSMLGTDHVSWTVARAPNPAWGNPSSASLMSIDCGGQSPSRPDSMKGIRSTLGAHIWHDPRRAPAQPSISTRVMLWWPWR